MIYWTAQELNNGTATGAYMEATIMDVKRVKKSTKSVGDPANVLLKYKPDPGKVTNEGTQFEEQEVTSLLTNDWHFIDELVTL